MRRVGGIILANGIRIGQKCVARKRLDGERVSRVKIEILFKPVGIKEIVTDPALRQRRQFMRIEVEFDAFTGTKYDEAVVGRAQEIVYVAVASVIAGGSRVWAGFAASRVGVGRVARGCKTFFQRET